ncbi:Putative Chitin binding protein [Penicillium brasilianum]|uniref:Putative Chitin binding protein n=1 Tax=Penicillium brasilianum TaxID=104259 RepID=A0A0F7VIF5_PENBI|nr:Putative Chitin binding protein [Penicillium brasilianum]
MKSFTTTSAAALAALLPLVHGHGFVTSPNPRMPGSAMKAACGNQVEVNQQSDNYGNIQGELQVAASQSDYNAAECDIWLCKGYKFADNQDNIYSYTAGQTIDFTVDIRAPHTGIANVSVVDTASNTVIGDPLIYWSVYASTATGVTANETSFSVTLPDNLGSQCATAGDCVLQWYWYAESIDQTYESCIDFSLGGSSSSSSTSTSTSSSSTVVTSSSAAATTSSSAAAAETTSAAVETSTSAAVETTTAQTTTAAIQAVTTFATQARQSSQPSTVTATSSSVASTLAIPTDSAQDTLDFVRSVFKYLVGSD